MPLKLVGDVPGGGGGRGGEGGGGGEHSNMKMPECVCWVSSEYLPILNDTFKLYNIPILKGFCTQFIPIFYVNIKL